MFLYTIKPQSQPRSAPTLWGLPAAQIKCGFTQFLETYRSVEFASGNFFRTYLQPSISQDCIEKALLREASQLMNGTVVLTKEVRTRYRWNYEIPHSLPQRPHFFWSAPRITTSLARSNDIPVLNGFVNTIDWDQNQSDFSDLTLRKRRVTLLKLPKWVFQLQ